MNGNKEVEKVLLQQPDIHKDPRGWLQCKSETSIWQNQWTRSSSENNKENKQKQSKHPSKRTKHNVETKTQQH